MAESLIDLEIESLAGGGYLATSGDLPGLVAQGRTIAECIEIAQDVARKLVESYIERGDPLTWDQSKRLKNLIDHGFDFLDAPKVFGGLTITFEDDRFDYGE